MTERSDAQMFLFSDDPVRCFETFAGVDEEFLQRVARLGLLSFDHREPGVTEERLLEVLFLKHVLRSGFPFEKVLQMLDQLEKPYRYDLSRLFWDLGASRWRFAHEAPSPAAPAEAVPADADAVIETLKDYASLDDRAALERVHAALHRMLGDAC